MVLYLNDTDVQQLLPMDTCIEVMEEVFQDAANGLTENRPRQHLALPSGGFHRVMAGGAYGPRFGAFGLKSYAAVKGGPRYMVLLYDAATANLSAIVEAKYLGQVRTGAVAGLATRHMARPDATQLAMIGTGREARSQLEAMVAVRSIQRVTCYSRTAERRDAFAQEMSARFDVEVTAFDTAEACVSGADIVCTITSTNTPVFFGAWLQPGMHLNAVGATSLYRQEIDAETVRRADTVVVEDVEQAREECGELIYAAERGLLRWPTVVELRHVVSGVQPGRRSAEAITLYNALGVASEDVAAAAYVYQQAQRNACGIELPIPARL
ncbi:MAG TPA: ornithine cyclodeaminase family protein [Chloroflexota bacterium]|jgi:ornithine cyclodeaminase/alanine dehydrogenase-like protein (mu-crystallin family)|nr:ornithine cyclodeaminase family protein [Chloroflexota bacterium]